MSTRPAPDKSARKVLAMFRQHGRVTGRTLLPTDLLTEFDTAEWTIANMMDGVLHALEQGWIEEVPNGEFKLTAAGWDATG